MGRSTRFNDIPSRPPVVMNSRISARGFNTTTDTRSATASLTAIALTGPGVLSFLAISTNAPQRYILTAYVDGTKAFSASGANVALIAGNYHVAVVGGFDIALTVALSTHSYGEIPFNESFLCMYACPDWSGAPTNTIAYDYRLTE